MLWPPWFRRLARQRCGERGQAESREFPVAGGGFAQAFRWPIGASAGGSGSSSTTATSKLGLGGGSNWRGVEETVVAAGGPSGWHIGPNVQLFRPL